MVGNVPVFEYTVGTRMIIINLNRLAMKSKSITFDWTIIFVVPGEESDHVRRTLRVLAKNAWLATCLAVFKILFHEFVNGIDKVGIAVTLFHNIVG